MLWKYGQVTGGAEIQCSSSLSKMSGWTEGTKVKFAMGGIWLDSSRRLFWEERVLVCEMTNLESAAKRLECDECERHDEK